MNKVHETKATSATAAKRVLIVDETGDPGREIAKTLAATGYDITVVKSAKAAEEALARLLSDIASDEDGGGSPNGLAMIVMKKDGKPAVVCVTASPMAPSLPPDDAILSALGASFDLVRLRQDWAAAEAAHRQTEELLRAILDNATAVIYAKDREGRYLFVNKRHEKLFGVTSAAIKGKADHEIFPPEFAAAFHRNDLQVFHSGQPIEIEEVAPHPDGPHSYISIKFPLFDADGAISGVCGISTDITDRKREAEQLRRAQQLEAIGQLSGGVAHDFNNLNSVILGNLELLEEQLEAGTPANKMVRRAIEAARRGTLLIERLLAFSRKQVLRPRPVDVNDLVQSTSDFLRHSVGENIGICTVLGRDVWPAFVDPGQLESAIINLAINARDAMPKGGALSIETRNHDLDEYGALRRGQIMPGSYVEISVRDTGVGIDPAIMDRVFEPFFTTKEVGKGTGLGLSMVYGFVAQSGGHVSLESGPGGTAVTLLLPRASSDAFRAEDETGGTAPDKAQSGETVLVVEDDSEVRNVTATFLKGLGYRVLEAGDAASALALLQGAPPVDLLLTDVVLSGSIGGRDLAVQIRAAQPDMRVLFMSGYADTGLSQDDLAAICARLIDKPFSRAELAAMVRASIDAVPCRPQPPRAPP